MTRQFRKRRGVKTVSDGVTGRKCGGALNPPKPAHGWRFVPHFCSNNARFSDWFQRSIISSPCLVGREVRNCLPTQGDTVSGKTVLSYTRESAHWCFHRTGAAARQRLVAGRRGGVVHRHGAPRVTKWMKARVETSSLCEHLLLIATKSKRLSVCWLTCSSYPRLHRRAICASERPLHRAPRVDRC